MQVLGELAGLPHSEQMRLTNALTNALRDNAQRLGFPRCGECGDYFEEAQLRGGFTSPRNRRIQEKLCTHCIDLLESGCSCADERCLNLNACRLAAYATARAAIERNDEA